ncbi:MAG: CBS domain-containing protein [Planctomycetota bacterium]
MQVSEFMTTSVVTVELDDSLKTVNKLFEHYGFHHLLVVEKGRLAGVVSDRDLLRALSAKIGTGAESEQDLATLRKKVHQVMTRKAVTLPPDATIFDAMTVFRQHSFSCIPVVDDDSKILGIISWRDILGAMLVAREASRATPEETT